MRCAMSMQYYADGSEGFGCASHLNISEGISVCQCLSICWYKCELMGMCMMQVAWKILAMNCGVLLTQTRAI